MHIYPTLRLALSTCSYLNPVVSDPQGEANDIRSFGIVVSAGRKALQLGLNHAQIVGCHDAEVVERRKLGFSERLSFSRMQFKDSKAAWMAFSKILYRWL
ncbi:hypothetical protein L207DRAFT_514877 [Hyaloscypha variabilis F]|uniref:Uncharacterized protein n=1 Tax=Hyaloscypha variabilis (strain UAMH 11265 / GT02V1 / F) TaxID=1149755 RepID=A0A2J6RGK8_HYAVF|nr:hypothetical protein L207DRAFT_514877 [Hyaloscypha variabilis F]